MLPVHAGVAGRRDGLLDVDHASLGAAGHAFVLLLQAAGQHDVRVVRGLRQEEVDDAEELEPLERLARERRTSGSETSGLKQIDSSALISPRWMASMISTAERPGAGDVVGRDAPHLRDVLARGGIGRCERAPGS